MIHIREVGGCCGAAPFLVFRTDREEESPWKNGQLLPCCMISTRPSAPRICRTMPLSPGWVWLPATSGRRPTTSDAGSIWTESWPICIPWSASPGSWACPLRGIPSNTAGAACLSSRASPTGSDGLTGTAACWGSRWSTMSSPPASGRSSRAAPLPGPLRRFLPASSITMQTGIRSGPSWRSTLPPRPSLSTALTRACWTWRTTRP